jgi:hypothetical protein
MSKNNFELPDDDDILDDELEEYQRMMTDTDGEPIEDFLIPIKELFENLPKTRMHIADTKKYMDALHTIRAVKDHVLNEDCDAMFDVHWDPIVGTSLCFVIVSDTVNVYNIEQMCETLRCVSTISVSARTDDMFEIGMTFEGVRQVIAVPDDQV